MNVEEGAVFFVLFLGELILLYTGIALVAVLSVGRWRVERVRAKEGRIYGAAGSLSFVRDGQRVITATGLYLIGLAFYVALAATLIKLASN